MTNSADGYAVSGAEIPQSESPNPTPGKPYLRRAAISAGIGGVLIAVVQYLAPDFDYQYAFLACLVIGLISFGVTLYYLHRASYRAGKPFLVPLTTLAVGVVFASLVRIRTMSGEMIPQFDWRFASHDVPELQTTPAGPASDVLLADATGDSRSDANVARSDGDTDVESTTTTNQGNNLVVTWGQFLGNDRNGAVKERTFAVPQSASEIETFWNIGIGGGWSSFAVAGDIAVTLEQREDRECVTAYRVTDGELLWIVDHEAMHTHPLGETGPRSTPAIEDGRVYAQGATGMVWCLDLMSGRVIWESDLLQLAGWDQIESETSVTWGRSGSPLLVDGLCVLPLGGTPDSRERSLVAFDAESGQVRWTAGEDQISYASPQLLTLDGVRQIVSVNESTISGHAIDSGEQLWHTDWFGQSNGGANCASVIPAGEDRFLIGKGYGGGSALIEVRRDDAGGGFVAEDVWRSNRVMKTKFNHAVIQDGVAYGISNGALQALEIESGSRLWEQSRRNRSGQGQVILAGDVMIVQEEMGDVIFVAADPSEYRELLRLKALQHKTWNVPTLAGNVLLVRNAVQAMAFQLPPK
ncbi:outer membrane protein assembly factor BamB family protein [Aporhodopirellula aestuarii]|uniref:PQQ-like beta-propeller repeat protein n=1 Tax=Aporhodopirellula aestuarii TaxID=2950107 RepID=A0ABT0U8B5_9BACT|nr:PQQ-binding-like beta-propeller repeat protein [Aporhodopirellula aestuarii]MCM2373026.1 PQQ-like beta-propeller repeat protein [Aporhodopirellula aestuarii]